VLQSLYNLSDVQIEYQVWDRATFARFVGLGSEDCIPDGNDAVAVSAKKLARGRADRDAVSIGFDQHLTAEGLYSRRRAGRWWMRALCRLPKQRNTREENEAVKRAARRPRKWERKPAKNRQKDKDARLDEEARVAASLATRTT